MIIQKEVEVAKITTLADGTIRLSIDILSGNSDDISAAYKLKYIPTTMMLLPTNDFIKAQQLPEEKADNTRIDLKDAQKQDSKIDDPFNFY
jgi:hypothetical protein